MSKFLTWFFLFYIINISCSSQSKSFSAYKITQIIKIDGSPDDAIWKEVAPISGFTTSIPVFGKKAEYETEVKIAYDNNAVYVFAYMYDNPKNIKRHLTARDDVDSKDVDVFGIGIDTYNDKQNAFSFKVSAAGVQEDAKISTIEDVTWNAVWESKVSLKANGWVAELKIPFSAIRFSKNNLQTWGIQFTRFRRMNNEVSTWSPDNPDIDGTMNRWGQWTGLKNILPRLGYHFFLIYRVVLMFHR